VNVQTPEACHSKRRFLQPLIKECADEQLGPEAAQKLECLASVDIGSGMDRNATLPGTQRHPSRFGEAAQGISERRCA
jgi:hypothetical protein